MFSRPSCRFVSPLLVRSPKSRSRVAAVSPLRSPDAPCFSLSFSLSRLQVDSHFIHLDVSHGAGRDMGFDQGLGRHWVTASVIVLAHGRNQGGLWWN